MSDGRRLFAKREPDGPDRPSLAGGDPLDELADLVTDGFVPGPTRAARPAARRPQPARNENRRAAFGPAAADPGGRNGMREDAGRPPRPSHDGSAGAPDRVAGPPSGAHREDAIGPARRREADRSDTAASGDVEVLPAPALPHGQGTFPSHESAAAAAPDPGPQAATGEAAAAPFAVETAEPPDDGPGGPGRAVAASAAAGPPEPARRAEAPRQPSAPSAPDDRAARPPVTGEAPGRREEDLAFGRRLLAELDAADADEEPAATPPGQGRAAPVAPPDAAARAPAPPGPDAPDPLGDALERELDSAITAIVSGEPSAPLPGVAPSDRTGRARHARTAGHEEHGYDFSHKAARAFFDRGFVKGAAPAASLPPAPADDDAPTATPAADGGPRNGEGAAPPLFPTRRPRRGVPFFRFVGEDGRDDPLEPPARPLDDPLSMGELDAAAVGRRGVPDGEALEDLAARNMEAVLLGPDLAPDEADDQAAAAAERRAAMRDLIEAGAEDADGDDWIDDWLEAGEERRRPRASRRSTAVIATVLGVFVLGAIGFFAAGAFFGGTVDDGPPPLIRAGETPYKVAPPEDAAAVADEEDLYNRLETAERADERLVVPERPSLPVSEEPVDRALLPDELVPRQVRTVVVRPDGTIVRTPEAGESAAGAPGAPPERAVTLADEEFGPPASGGPAEAGQAGAAGGAPVPSVLSGEVTPVAVAEVAVTEGATPEDPSGASAAGAEALAAAAGFPLPRSRPPVTPPPGRRPAAEPTPTAAVAAAAPPEPVTAGQPTGTVASAPVPIVPGAAPTGPGATPRRSFEIDNNVVRPGSTARLAAPAPAVPADPAPLSLADGTTRSDEVGPVSAPWAVQVSSRRTETAARDSYAALQRRFAGLLGGREALIEPAQLGARGTFYRVRLPMGSRSEAAQLCANLKSAGGDCFISRN